MPSGIYKRTDSHKEKHRQRMLGDKNPAKRLEVREKIRQTLKGRKPSFITRERLSKGQYLRWLKKRNYLPLLSKEDIAGRAKPYNCEICGNSGKICFDHDHETGKFRGWICSHCNLVLGLMKDNVNTLEVMVEYLRSNIGQ